MTGTIDIMCTVPAPTLEQVRAWLTRTGWTVSTSWLDQAPHNERWSHEVHGSAWVPREELADWLVYVSTWIVNRAWQIGGTPEAVYREIVGPTKAWAVWVVAERWEGGVRGIFESKRGALLWRMREKCREATEARHFRLIHGNALCGHSLDREPGSDHEYGAKHLRDYGHEQVVYEREVQP